MFPPRVRYSSARWAPGGEASGAWALFLALVLAPQAARAHDLWWESGASGFVLHHGHRGGDSLPIEGARIRSIRCANGSKVRDVLAGAVFGAKEVRVVAACAAISAAYGEGQVANAPDSERPRSQVLLGATPWESRVFAKWVDPRSDAAFEELGDELEIVPARDVGRVRAGDKIAIRVQLGGKPVAGALVTYRSSPVGETDRHGETRLRLQSPGLQEIGATLRRPSKQPEMNSLVLQANLFFELSR